MNALLLGDRTLFLIEAKQAGIFEIRNIPQDQVQQIVGIATSGDVLGYRSLFADKPNSVTAEALEEVLISADVGVGAAERIVQAIQTYAEH